MESSLYNIEIRPDDQPVLPPKLPLSPRARREKPKKWPFSRIFMLGVYLLLAAALLAALGVAGYEMRTSHFQAQYLARLAAACTFRLAPGPSPAVRFPLAGPYDERLGYVGLPHFIRRLTASGYEITDQAQISPTLLQSLDLGLFPPYREKAQAGLRIVGPQDKTVFAASYPERIHSDYSAIPEIAVQALLFIENRELLDTRYPTRNPAVEWDRLAKAVVDMAISTVNRSHRVPGGSTLATQLAKYRHSPDGQTSSARDKIKQMVSASLRAYLAGEETKTVRKEIIQDFINSMPLGASPGFGEVTGLGDGLYAWYGADFESTRQGLLNRPADAKAPNLESWALGMKQVVSLFVAQRRPSYYLSEEPAALETKTNSYIRIMAETGLLTPWEREAALRQELKILRRAEAPEKTSFVERKAANAVRTHLLSLLGLQQLYQLNHLDLTVKSTLDEQSQQEVTEHLVKLLNPAQAEAEGLRAQRLLEHSDPAKVIYSLTLYEHVDGANLLRIQTDNLDQPLNINEGSKLELGSSAKLRTLITYLEIIAALHGRFAPMSVPQRQAALLQTRDRLSLWAIEYLNTSADQELTTMLTAAMNRTYSANPDEHFFTGGGAHTFVNFNPKDDDSVFTVTDALHNSINLVFIRMMRDVVQYYTCQIPGGGELMVDVNDPKRQEYLAQFADQEGRQFLQNFYNKYKGKSLEESLAILLQGINPTPEKLSAVFRYIKPTADESALSTFLQAHFSDPVLSAETVRKLYKNYAPEAWSLVDRGYIARTHPLELWVISYLGNHPGTKREEMMQAGAAERQAVYGWLFKTSRKNKQDIRIRAMLEVEAFHEIHAAWKRLKYPFDSLVPSYATAIGSSADRPAALAELMGIIVNDGKWFPSIRVQELHFGADTPYETILKQPTGSGEQLLRPEVAKVAREALLGVVTDGTAKRVLNAFHRLDGTTMAVGGKTGTGDNRRETYGAGGRLINSKVINRTAVFVFYLGDRFFGCITAYVAGKTAADYKFTSGLPVQVLKSLAPTLAPLVGKPTAHPEEPSPLALQTAN